MRQHRRGAGRIHPSYAWRDATAERYAADHRAVLASKERRSGRPSLSPASLQSIPAGLQLVLPSPIGAALAWQARALGTTDLSPEAGAALALYESLGTQRHQSLASCSSALELLERGFEDDVALCLTEDASAVASRLRG